MGPTLYLHNNNGQFSFASTPQPLAPGQLDATQQRQIALAVGAGVLLLAPGAWKLLALPIVFVGGLIGTSW